MGAQVSKCNGLISPTTRQGQTLKKVGRSFHKTTLSKFTKMDCLFGVNALLRVGEIEPMSPLDSHCNNLISFRILLYIKVCLSL